ncbi:MAG TPA: methyltransferase domain-containing protein [Anaerolineales bacterium]|nr:methyltransferase domain-containing protein [Anaerolineales bacterium]
MHTYLIEMLECPACHGKLDWSIAEQNENHIEAAEAHCNTCAATYSVRDGIGLFLTPELQLNDLWEQVDSGLLQHLREHPELERQLMEVSPDTLAPADRFFRALVLEEQGHYFEARVVEASANLGLYTPQYMNCWDSQMDYVVEWLDTTEGPIVDLASGRGYLVEKLARRLKNPIVATDFSSRVLRRDRRWLESLGLYDRVSLLAFDARHTPFKDGAVGTLTTNLGLPNIEEPGHLLGELRRIVTGAFLAISFFFREDDRANAKVIHEAKLEALLYRRTALEHYRAAGWNVEVKNACVGEAHPTPAGVVLDGARVDNLPVANTRLEWCVLLGTNKLSNSKLDAN